MLLVAGQFASTDLERAVEPLLRAPGIVRLPYLEEREFWLAASAVDACINLRDPAAGETSGIAIRLMGIGKPVLLTDAAGVRALSRGRLHPHRAGSGGARQPTAPHDSANIDFWGGPCHRPAGGRTRSGIPSGGVHRETLLGPSVRVSCLILIGCAAFGGPVQQSQRAVRVAVRMRDGVRLSANVFLPAVEGRVPAILIRTPYGKGDILNGNWQAFVDHGYAVVVQDVRGRYESEGVFDSLHQEPADGDDTLNWIAAPIMVQRQGRDDRRIVPRDRAMESGAAQQSAPQGDFSGGLGI